MNRFAQSVAHPEVHAPSQSTDLLLQSEFELLTFSMPEPFSFAWMNRSQIEHHSSNLLALVDLLRQVGWTEEWAWVETWPLHNRNLIAQACGRSDRGFVVEIGSRQHTERVVRSGAAYFPKVNVATKLWAYYCAQDELLDLGTAAMVMCDWLTSTAIDSAWNFRPPFVHPSLH